MRTLRDIRKIIRSVKNTQKITKAMKMVAAAKLRRAQSKLTLFRSYTNALNLTLEGILKRSEAIEHPYFKSASGPKKILVILVSADRGLCGSYNMNIFKELESFKRSKGIDREYSFIAVGRRGRDYLRRRGQNIIKEYIMLGGTYSKDIFDEIKKNAVGEFIAGRADEVYLLFSTFHSALSQKPTILQLLPFKQSAAGGRSMINYIYEPDFLSVLNRLSDEYLSVRIQAGIFEATASEFGARMTAMDSATNNAADMIDNLTLQMNRSRQASITKELMDIINGVESMRTK
ncbi:MAG TPA: ATP synthase F1 subunit gamma [bacterium]